MKTKFLVLTLFTFLLILGCQTGSEEAFNLETSLKEIPVKPPIYVDLGNTSNPVFMKSVSGKIIEVIPYMAEYFTVGNSDEVGNTIFFNSRGNNQLLADFPIDPWYLDLIDGTNDISYYVDNSRPSDDIKNVSVSNAAIDRAMNTWGGVNCANGLAIIERPYNPALKTGVFAGERFRPPYIDPVIGWVADVVHAGWMPPNFFNLFFPGGSENILGVTITYITGLDEDNNGKPDVWFREIYYNDYFKWGNGGYDVETVALHETGHALSQSHFGKAFARGTDPTDPKWKFHFAPRAVMNASYSGIQTNIRKTDNRTHCNIWGEWPNN